MAHNAALDWWRGVAASAKRGGQSLETWDLPDPRPRRAAVLDAELAGAVLRALRHAVPAVAQRLCVLAALCMDVLDAERAAEALDAEERSCLRARGATGLLTRGAEGLSRKAVGEALGFSHDATRQVVSRGMRVLRSHVQGCAECRLDWLVSE
jgi:DNA-directed RNA polymerase specialized sigma24 family protein